MDLYGDLPPPGTEGGRVAVKFAVQSGSKTKTQPPGGAPMKSSSAAAESSVQPPPSAAGSRVQATSVAPLKAVFKPRQTVTRDTASKKPIPVPGAYSVPSATPISSTSTSSSAPAEPTVRFVEVGSFEIEDPYDPSRPNDYLQFCEERLEQRRLKRLEKENERVLQERERERERVERERQEAVESGDVQRLEASLGGRGRGRGLSNLPSWMTAGTKTSDQEQSGGTESSAIHDVPSQIMSRMGFEEGSGLGRHGQGITSAIEVRQDGSNRGVIITGKAHREESFPSKKQRIKVVAPSCVILLRNFVQGNESDENSRERVTQHCGKYGRILNCRVHRKNDPHLSLEEQIAVFVTFERLGTISPSNNES